MPSVDNEGPDQTAHLRSLIRAFVVYLQILRNISTNTENLAQTGQMCSLVGGFRVRIMPS